MWRIKATAKGRRKHRREQRSPEIGEGWEKVMVVGKVERREKEVWIAKLTVSFCLYKHLGSTSAPINNTQQISRLDRKGVRVAECWKGVCEHAAESECFDETRACKWKCTTVYVYCANIHILNILLCTFSLVPCVSSELSAFMACVCCLCIHKAFLWALSLSRSALSRLLQAIMSVGQLTFSTETEQKKCRVSVVLKLEQESAHVLMFSLPNQQAEREMKQNKTVYSYDSKKGREMNYSAIVVSVFGTQLHSSLLCQEKRGWVCDLSTAMVKWVRAPVCDDNDMMCSLVKVDTVPAWEASKCQTLIKSY